MQNREMVEACKERDALLRQQEILFDIAYGLGAKVVHDNEDLMDWLQGSRGLLAKVLEWAKQFDEIWRQWETNDTIEHDYFIEIDAFITAKYISLVAEFEADQRRVVSIQVVPVIDRVEIVAQTEGPTEETTGWSVYTRDRVGLAHWYADTHGEEQAMFIGGALAAKYNVQIEAQLWKGKIDGQAS